MKIGELGRRTATSVETIRYYEREGLLGEPERSAANYRQYDLGHLERLTFIRNCRALEMSLEEIRMLLRLKDQSEVGCGQVNTILEEHIGHVEERIASLKRLKNQLLSLREQCRQVKTVADCAILKGLAAPGDGPGPEDRSGRHMHGPHSVKS